jgi:hypothetical protein
VGVPPEGAALHLGVALGLLDAQDGGVEAF